MDDHAQYCKQVLHTTLARYIRTVIRVKYHRDYLVIETLQRTITPAQHQAIKRLYRQHRCLELIAVIGRVQVRVDDLRHCVSSGKVR